MGNVAIFKGKLVKFLAKAGILVPARPDAERSLTPTAGETAFNTTANKLEVYDGTTWTQLDAGGGTGNGLDHPTNESTFEFGTNNPSMNGTGNTVIGVGSGNVIVEGTDNTIFGKGSGTLLTTATNNTLIGANVANTYTFTGFGNVAVGNGSGSQLENGGTNTCIGTGSLSSIRYGSGNVGLGINSGKNYGASSSYNTAINNLGPNNEDTYVTGTVVIGKDSSGNGAFCTKDNEFVLGTTNHLYNFPGIIQSGIKLGQSANSTSYVTLQSATTGTPVTWTLPVSNGNSGDVLTTNGTGTLSWSPASGGGTSVAQLNDAAPVNLDNYMFASDNISSPFIKTIAIKNDNIYIGGFFNYITKRSNIKVFNAALTNSTNSSVLSGINPTAFDGQVQCSLVVGDYIYVGGDFLSYNDKPAVRLAKISLIDQSLDTTFDTKIGCNGRVNSIAIDNTGNNLFIGGLFTSVRGVTRNRIAKLNSTTAKLDTIFDPAGGFNGDVKSIAFGASQHLYVGGSFTQYNSMSYTGLVKMSAVTAEANSTFHSVLLGASNVTSVVLDNTESNIYIGGGFASYRGTTRNRLAKINALNGVVDPLFDTTTGANNTVNKIVLSSDNLFLFAAGLFDSYKGQPRERIVKINTSDATIVSLFDAQIGFDSDVTDIALDSTGTNLYATGSFTTYKGLTRRRVAKLSASDAVANVSFDSSNALRFGDGFQTIGYTIALYNSNNILFVGGLFKEYDIVNNYFRRGSLVKINKLTGDIDTAFNVDVGFGGSTVNSIIVDSTDSSVYVGGGFITYQGNSKGNIVKLNSSDASIITAFTGYTNSTIHTMVMNNTQTHLYIGGDFTTANGVTRSYLAKILTSDGSNDSTFDTTTGFNSGVRSILLNADETNIFAGGLFTLYKSNNRGKIAKINASDASIDATFAPTTGFTGAVLRLAFNAAKTAIYATGTFDSFQSQTVQRLAKIDTIFGAASSQFNTVTAFNTSTDGIYVDADDTVYVGCGSNAFTFTYKGITRTGLVKLNGITADLDTKFDSLMNYATDAVTCITKDNEGNLYIGQTASRLSYRNQLSSGFMKLDATTAYYKTIQTSAALSTYQLQNSDSNAVLIVNSNNVTDIIVPSGLSSSFNCSIVLNGLGNVRIITNSGNVNLNSSTGFRITTRYGRAYIVASSSNNFNISGNVVV